MANNAIGDTLVLTGASQKFVENEMVFSFRLTADPFNVGTVTVTTPSGGTHTYYPGSRSEFYRSVDLSGFSVIGSDAGDSISYDGGTW